ncbi:uncharacterized protein LOC136084978 [Hydra vulgaris]|uniref:Uncharacterized protein LOC136084978 n=1 Tax=Hydra vulgaris TaxID=6087 RepID=A0ABM4CKZ3_HYDVU
MNRKKLSGAQNRALASKRAKECEKNKQTLQELHWFYKATNQNTDLKSAELNKSEQTIELSYYDLHSLGSVENETDDSFNDELKPEENKGVENDPALWPSILEQKEKEEIIKKCPSTLPDDFPRDASNNRAFPKEVLFIALPNGEKF